MIHFTDPAAASSLLKDGFIVAIPTETVYGLAGNALSEKAVRKIFALKGRPSSNPLICHLSTAEEVFRYAEWSAAAERLSQYWPGPLTVLLPHKGRIPSIVTAGSELAGFRIPDHPLTLELLRLCDFPVAAPSANRSGERSPTDIQMVIDHFGEAVEGYLDGGPCRIGLESTVVKICDADTLQILRPGAITEERLQSDGFRIIPFQQTDEKNLLSPGLLKKHYSPSLPLAVFTQSPPREETAVLSDFFAYGETDRLIYLSHSDHDPHLRLFPRHEMLSHTGSLEESARNLFQIFDRASRKNAAFLLLKKFPDSGIGKALNDRITRAADYLFFISESGISIYRMR